MGQGSTAGVRELTRRAAMLGVPVEVLDGGRGSAPMHSPGMARCAAPLRSVFAGTSFGPPRRRLVSTITGDLIVTAGPGPDAGLAARAAECGGVPAVPIPAAPSPGNRLPPGDGNMPGAALTQAIAALFTAGALTDVTPFLAAAREEDSGGGQALSGGRAACVPRMRCAEESAPAGAVNCGGGGRPGPFGN